MAKVLVVVDDSCVELPAVVRGLLGDDHEYKVVTVAPNRHTPFLDEGTVRGAQAEIDTEYAGIAEQAARPARASADVLAGDPGVEAVVAAGEERADIVVVGTRRRGLWSRLTGRHPLDHLLAHAPCPVLVVPRPPRR